MTMASGQGRSRQIADFGLSHVSDLPSTTADALPYTISAQDAVGKTTIQKRKNTYYAMHRIR